MMTKAESKQVAETILAQLGGGRFIAMTGANSFTSGENGELTFKYPRRKGFSHSAVKISLNVMDTYDVEFIDMRRNMTFERKTIANVYNDQLQTVFTAETGLLTSL